MVVLLVGVVPTDATIVTLSLISVHPVFAPLLDRRPSGLGIFLEGGGFIVGVTVRTPSAFPPVYRRGVANQDQSLWLGAMLGALSNIETRRRSNREGQGNFMIQPGAFATRALAAAHLPRKAGAQSGQPVVAITASSEALATLALAAPAISAPLFPVDPTLPASIIAALISQIGGCLMVGDGQTLSTENILAAASSAPMRWTPQKGPALLIATSGSSGQSKVVTLTGDNLVAAANASSKVTPLKPGDRWLACLPLFHIGGYSILTRCALAGAEPILHQGFDAERVLHSLTTERISHLSLTPTMLAQVLAIGRLPPACLRHVLVGGAALSSAWAQRAADDGWPIQPTYGMSETGSQLATLSCLPCGWRSGHVGRALKGVDIRLGQGRPAESARANGDGWLRQFNANPRRRPCRRLVSH